MRTWRTRRDRTRTMGSPTALRLIAHLRAHGIEIGGDPHLYSIKRTYAGRNQRSAGAWSWTLEYHGPETELKTFAMGTGSQWPATYLLARKIEGTLDRFGQMHIDPCGPISALPDMERQASNF